MSNPCDAKKLYDTEFEAEIAASKMGYKWGAEMEHYRCGRHWHIANKDPSLRSRKRTFSRTYCEACDCYMKKGRWKAHQTMRRHIRLSEKRKETL